MSSVTRFKIEHNLSDQWEIVYNSLLDLRKFGEIHPHMTDVRIINNNLPDHVEYAITEKVYLLGFIKNHPRYNANVAEVQKNRHIRYTSQVKPTIFLTVDITFSKNSSHRLIVTEEFEIRSNKLLGLVFANILKKAHLRSFENLNKILRNSVEESQLH